MKMPNSKNWQDDLKKNLTHRQNLSLYRQLIANEPCGSEINRQGHLLLNLAGNDYLALSDHPIIKSAAQDAIAQFGVGSGASKLVTGQSHEPMPLS